MAGLEDEAAAQAVERAAQARERTRRAAERSTAAARQVAENLETARRLSSEIATTETRRASTLREMAGRVSRQGRAADAERLTDEAQAAENYAAVERQRGEAD
jgi:hypothetical protein